MPPPPTSDRREEYSNEDGERRQNVHSDAVAHGVRPGVVLGRIVALGEHVALGVVVVVDVFPDDPAGDAADPPGKVDLAVFKVLVALVHLRGGLVAGHVGVVGEDGAPLVPQLGPVDRVLDAVFHLLHQPGAHYADAETKRPC